MKYQDNQKKFIAVLNKKTSIPRLMNALGHMSIGLPSILKDDPEFMEYSGQNSEHHATISKYPFIILAAKNSNQLRVLRDKLLQAGLPCNDFLDTMVAGSWKEQLDATASADVNDLNFFGITTFGNSEKLTPLTKKFSLWK